MNKKGQAIEAFAKIGLALLFLAVIAYLIYIGAKGYQDGQTCQGMTGNPCKLVCDPATEEEIPLPECRAKGEMCCKPKPETLNNNLGPGSNNDDSNGETPGESYDIQFSLRRQDGLTLGRKFLVNQKQELYATFTGSDVNTNTLCSVRIFYSTDLISLAENTRTIDEFKFFKCTQGKTFDYTPTQNQFQLTYDCSDCIHIQLVAHKGETEVSDWINLMGEKTYKFSLESLIPPITPIETDTCPYTTCNDITVSTDCNNPPFECENIIEGCVWENNVCYSCEQADCNFYNNRERCLGSNIHCQNENTEDNCYWSSPSLWIDSCKTCGYNTRFCYNYNDRWSCVLDSCEVAETTGGCYWNPGALGNGDCGMCPAFNPNGNSCSIYDTSDLCLEDSCGYDDNQGVDCVWEENHCATIIETPA